MTPRNRKPAPITGRRVANMALLGFLGMVVAYAVVARGLAGQDPRYTPAGLMFAGAELTRGGAETEVLYLPETVIHQACRGVCDDLITRDGPLLAFRALDAARHCVVCEWGSPAGLLLSFLLGKPNVELVTNGTDVSAAGGVKVVLQHEYGSVTQGCNGVCDDLHITAVSGDDVYGVRVLDSAGKCMVCDTDQYVSSDYSSLKNRWTVAGSPLRGQRSRR